MNDESIGLEKDMGKDVNEKTNSEEGGRKMVTRGKAKRFFGLVFLSTLFVLTGWSGVQAQGRYPTKAIDIIVPATSGGASDLSTRITADFLKKAWGVPVNVVNKPGGGMLLGTVEMYNAAPDGYTMLCDGLPISTLMPFALKDLPVNIMDRTFIAATTGAPHIFVVHANSPLRTLEDVIREVKKDPANFTWSAIGGVTTQEVMLRQFFKVIGVDIRRTKPVVTRGGGDVAALVAGGHVKLGVVSSSAGMSIIKGGLVKGLMISTKERDPNYPDIPTGAELGYPEVNVVMWSGISGPPKLPSHIVAIWEETLQKIVKDPTYIDQMKKIGFVVDFKGSLELREHVKKGIEELRELFK